MAWFSLESNASWFCTFEEKGQNRAEWLKSLFLKFAALYLASGAKVYDLD